MTTLYELYFKIRQIENLIKGLHLIFLVVHNIRALYLFFELCTIFVGGESVNYTGGYSILVRLLRDLSIDAYYWADKYCENIFSKDFEYQNKVLKIDLLTAFKARALLVKFIKRTLVSKTFADHQLCIEKYTNQK